MATRNRQTEQTNEILRLQTTARLRWQALLGYPPLAASVCVTLKPLAVRNDRIHAALALWSNSAARIKQQALGAPRAFRAATNLLARLLATADQFGRTAVTLRRATEDALAGRRSATAIAHLFTVRHFCDQHVQQRNRLLRVNLGLVRMAVNRMGVPAEHREDLVQEGIFGLMRALECYDPTRGTRFSTYAIYWIRAEVVRAKAQQDHEVRVPLHVLTNQRAYGRAMAKLDRGQPAERMRQHAKQLTGLTERQVQALESIPISDASSALLHAPAQACDQVDELYQRQMLQRLSFALPQLPARERAIVEYRFELSGRPFRTLDALARDTGLSRERVRQIQLSALDTLRGYVFRTPLNPRARTAAPVLGLPL